MKLQLLVSLYKTYFIFGHIFMVNLYLGLIDLLVSENHVNKNMTNPNKKQKIITRFVSLKSDLLIPRSEWFVSVDFLFLLQHKLKSVTNDYFHS